VADETVVIADVQPSTGIKSKTGTAAEDIDAGEAVFIGAAVGGGLPPVSLADTDDLSGGHVLGGIAVNSAANGQPVNYITADPDFDPGFAATAGAIYILSSNPGKIAPVADLASGWFPVLVYFGKGNSNVNLGVVVTNSGSDSVP